MVHFFYNRFEFLVQKLEQPIARHCLQFPSHFSVTRAISSIFFLFLPLNPLLLLYLLIFFLFSSLSIIRCTSNLSVLYLCRLVCSNITFQNVHVSSNVQTFQLLPLISVYICDKDFINLLVIFTLG